VEAEEAPLTVTVTVLGAAQVAEMVAAVLAWDETTRAEVEVEPETGATVLTWEEEAEAETGATVLA